ncbi:MAG: hypothetical protein KDA91_20970 [Planctomycetaceae bacterium]|nr:hypothetical protein [Planctomycetaceae bacterium]
MFQTSQQCLQILIDVSVKSLLLAAIAFAAIKLLRLRDSNLEHRIWSGVLFGMLALPILTCFLPSIPVYVSMDWISAPKTSADVSVAATESVPSEHWHAADQQGLPEFRMSRSGGPGLVRSTDTQLVRPETLPAAEAASASGNPHQVMTVMIVSLIVIWGLVAAFLVLRLLVGLWSASQLLKGATVVTSDAVIEPLTLSGVRGVTIRETCQVRVPMTVGWCRPAVLLPAEWRSWSSGKLKAIISHELAHVARRDFLVAFAGELNFCVYWFHPVAWFLQRRLSDLAEEACDDAAIGCTGDRTGYARYLLEVASQLSGGGRRVQPGLSMARESNVESRIATILDFQRPLSQRLPWKTTAGIALIAAPVIASAAALEPVNPQNIAVADEPPENSTAASLEEMVRVRGQVLDESGRPLSTARVTVWRSQRPDWYAADSMNTRVGVLKVDRNGQFDQKFAASELPVAKDARDHSWSVLVVSAPGFAVRGMTGMERTDSVNVSNPNFLKEFVTIKLPVSVTISARLLSTEGLPIANANVSLHHLMTTESTPLTNWLTRADKQPKPQDHMNALSMMGGPPEEGTLFPGQNLRIPTEVMEPVMTDNLGVFEITDLVGKDDLAVLRFRGDNVVDTTAHVVAREMEPVYGRSTTRFTRYEAYHGRLFNMALKPSVPIQGFVRDIETKKPLANVWVAVRQAYGSVMSREGYVKSRTDAEGHYRIEGLPIPPEGTKRYRGNTLTVRPSGLPYLETDLEVPSTGDNTAPVEFNIELRRAVIAKGRLTVKSTGDPIVGAKLYYAPYVENENVSKYHRYADGSIEMLGNDTRYYTNDNGEFDLPIIPGRGVIGARAPTGGYISGYGARDIEAFQSTEGGLSRKLSDHMIASSFHALQEIDVPRTVQTYDVAMEADSGVSLSVQFIDPQSKPLTNVRGYGLTSDRNWQVINTDQPVATGLEIGGIRPAHFTNESGSLTVMTRIIPEPGQEAVTIQLFRPGVITGRLVDTERAPIVGAVLQASHQNDPDSWGSEQQIRTDKDGHFEYFVPVGTKYEIRVAYENNRVRIARDLEMDRTKKIDLGEFVLSDQEANGATVKPDRAPIVTELPEREVK